MENNLVEGKYIQLAAQEIPEVEEQQEKSSYEEVHLVVNINVLDPFEIYRQVEEGQGMEEETSDNVFKKYIVRTR